MQKGNFTPLKVATESASLYNIYLLDFLVASENLVPFSPEIYQFNPKITSGFKKVYSDEDKIDDTNAFVIADRLRFGRLPAPYIKHQDYLPLQRLTRYRFQLVEPIALRKKLFSYSSISKVFLLL